MIGDSFSERNFVGTLMFADDLVIIAENENSLQRAVYELQQIVRIVAGLEISVTKTMDFKGCFPVKCKVALNDQLIEQMHSFRFLGCDLSHVGEIDVDKKK